MSDSFAVSRDGDVTSIVTDKAGDGNRFSDEMAIEMAETLDKESKSARLIVFKGAGKDFCLGRAGGMGRPPGEAYDFRVGFEAVFNCYDSFRRCRAPIL